MERVLLFKLHAPWHMGMLLTHNLQEPTVSGEPPTNIVCLQNHTNGHTNMEAEMGNLLDSTGQLYILDYLNVRILHCTS